MAWEYHTNKEPGTKYLNPQPMQHLTTLEYFMAHAPAEPQEWFEPVMEEASRMDNPHIKNALDKQLRLTAERKAEREKQRHLQWPLAWAQEMVKRLPIDPTEQRDAFREELNSIRKVIGADPDEATIDEVNRLYDFYVRLLQCLKGITETRDSKWYGLSTGLIKDIEND